MHEGSHVDKGQFWPSRKLTKMDDVVGVGFNHVRRLSDEVSLYSNKKGIYISEESKGKVTVACSLG